MERVQNVTVSDSNNINCNNNNKNITNHYHYHFHHYQIYNININPSDSNKGHSFLHQMVIISLCIFLIFECLTFYSRMNDQALNEDLLQSIHHSNNIEKSIDFIIFCPGKLNSASSITKNNYNLNIDDWLSWNKWKFTSINQISTENDVIDRCKNALNCVFKWKMIIYVNRRRCIIRM